MLTTCETVVLRVDQDLHEEFVPAESIAEKILWFNKFWKLNGFTFGASSNGVPVTSDSIGDAEGLKDKTVFVCDSRSGECQVLPMFTEESIKARPAPREYLELLDRYPEALTDFKFRFVPVNIVGMDNGILVNAYSDHSLDLIARMTSCSTLEAPRVLVDRLHWWGITKNRFTYDHYCPEDYLFGLMRPLDKCGECHQNKRVKICTACRFNLLCRACKCSHCDMMKNVYDKMSQARRFETCR